MKHTVRGAIIGLDQTIQTEIEFDGTIAGVMVLTFSTEEQARDYKNNVALKHCLPFYDEVGVEGCQVRLQRKRNP